MGRERPPPTARVAGRRRRKALGQHFLARRSIARRIAEAAGLTPDSTVLEVGPGRGILTAELASRARRVIAIELDDALAALLSERYSGSNVEIIHADALQVQPADVLQSDRSYTLVGNLPYSVSQPLLRHFLEATPQPGSLVVMVQSEVADSICAEAGDLSLLSVSVQLYGTPRVLFRVPPSAFRPPPKVRSAVVRIEVAAEPRVSVRDTAAFFRLVRACFETRRKQLRNGLAHGLRIDASLAEQLLRDAGIDPTQRPQELSLEAWGALDDAWGARGRPEGAP